MAPLILLVHVDETELRQADQFLSMHGYLVSSASSFRRASKLLKWVIPDLIVVEPQLGEFSGLQLATLSKRDHPHLPVLLTYPSPDAAVEEEARRRQFAFAAGPLTGEAFLDAVRAALGEQRPLQAMIRRWPRKPVVGAQLAAPPARVVDISYGGFRLLRPEPGGADTRVFNITLPDSYVTLSAERVWTSRAPGTDDFWWGAQVIESDPARLSRWREFVDAFA